MFLILFLLFASSILGQNVDPWEVRCLICKITVQEMIEAVSKVDPKKVADVGGFRLDPAGNAISKTIPYARSEVYLTELMENICEKMEDYAKVRYKKNGRLSVIKFMVDGHMNPETSEVDFVQDGDLNKSLKHYCLEILEEHDEVFLDKFMQDVLGNDLDITICSQKAGYCKDAPLQEEYNLEDDDTLREEL